jgi:hypothetical protein
MSRELMEKKEEEEEEEPTLAIEGERMRNAAKRSKETGLEWESMAGFLWLGLEAKERGRDRTRWGLILEVGELNTVWGSREGISNSVETREREREREVQRGLRVLDMGHGGRSEKDLCCL